MTVRQSALTPMLCLVASIVLGVAVDARADIVTDWNQTAIRATGIAGAPPPVQARALAMVHAAIFDAVNTITASFTVYAIDITSCLVLRSKLRRQRRHMASWIGCTHCKSRSPMPPLPPRWPELPTVRQKRRA